VGSPARLAAQCRCVSVSNEYEGTSLNRGNGIGVPRLNLAEVNLNLRKGKSMSEITRVGVDLAKRLIQVHGVDATERPVVKRAISRDRFLAWCAQLPAGCVVAMESCSGAHHWARRLQALGLQPRLIAPHFVTPYRMEGKGGKNDATDAAAVCEAASRPAMRFVPVKSCVQQGVLCVHRLREAYKEERTGCINRIRGLLSEFGLVYPKGPQALRQVLLSVLEDASNELPGLARLALERAFAHWRELDAQLAWCEARICEHARQDGQAKEAMRLDGVGPVSASALVASVGDFRQFRSAGQFAAWLGLVPRQNSSGGKASLGSITKRGDDYLRTLLIQGARSAIATATRRQDRISRWIVQLQLRIGWQKALVALANKNARILWAVLARGKPFDAQHVAATAAAA
jgi:transposase